MNDTQNIERPLPHSLEAERAVLGSIFLGSPGVSEAIMQLESSDFFLTEHRIIYQHVSRVVEQGKPPDTVLVLDSILTNGEIEAAGGAGYISQIADGMPRLNNLRFYVEILKVKAQLRKRAYTAHAIVEMALAANGNAAEVLNEIGILSAQLREEVGQKRILKFRSGAEIAMTTGEQIEWIVPGFVARGAVTELGAKVKAGKTTLITKLVRAVADGLDFLGKPTMKSPTVYLTEQPIVSFRQAMDRAGLLGRPDFHVLQHTDTRGLSWPEVVAAAVHECKRVGAMLLVIDTLPQFAGLKGDSENNSGDALTAMEPILQAAADGIGIILVRHERKSGGDIGDSGRGSSAFAGAVDMVLSLRRPEGNAKKTLRVLHALSRFSETPSEVLLELTDAGYISLGEPVEAALREAKESILSIAPDSEPDAVSIKELTKGANVPRATAQRAVKELTDEGAMGRVGEGKKGMPFLYFRNENRFSPTSNIEGQKERLDDGGQRR